MGWPPYTVVLRLYAVADAHWPQIDGDLAQRGIDPFTLPVHRFCNLIYAWAVARVQDREHFDAVLNERTGPNRPAPFSEADEAASWGALMGTAMPGRAG